MYSVGQIISNNRKKKGYSQPELAAALEKEGISMPYWTFVNFAKEAGATWALRKTAMVDLDKLDKYLDEHCNLTQEREEQAMPRVRKEVENIEELVKEHKKKYVRYAEGAALYSLGLHTFQEIAKDAGAIRRVKGCVLVNTEKVDAFIESLEEEY